MGLAHIKAIAGAIPVTHPFFDYLPQDEKEEIYERQQKGISQTIGFFQADKTICAIVLDFGPDSIHVRQMGGNFPSIIRYIETYCAGLCLFAKKNKLTFCTSRKAVAKIGKKLGFVLNDDGDYEKEITHGREIQQQTKQ